MKVYGFPPERGARHVAKGRDKILARKLPVQLAVHHAPSCRFGEQCCNLWIGKFFCRHLASLRNRLASFQAIMRRKPRPSNNFSSTRANRAVRTLGMVLR